MRRSWNTQAPTRLGAPVIWGHITKLWQQQQTAQAGAAGASRMRDEGGAGAGE